MDNYKYKVEYLDDETGEIELYIGTRIQCQDFIENNLTIDKVPQKHIRNT